MIQKPSLEKASKQWLKYKESADKAISEGNYDLSESVLFAALTEAQEYFEETDYQLIYTLEKLVQSLWFLGRFDEAIEHCQKLVDIHERHPEELEPVNRLAYTINLAMVNHAARQFDQGDRYYLDAFNLAKKSVRDRAHNRRKNSWSSCRPAGQGRLYRKDAITSH